MSHRDQCGDIGSRSHAQDLGVVVDWLLKGIDVRSIGFRKDCRWSVTSLITAALFWAWSDEKGLLERFSTALKLSRQLMPSGTPDRCAYQSVMKLLVRWTGDLMLLLKEVLRARMQASLRSRFYLHGFAIFGADGSRISLARTASNEACYSPKKWQKQKAGRGRARPRSTAARAAHAKQKKGDSPQMWITTLWHAGIGLPWEWVCGASDSSERHHVREMVATLPANALVACDACFVGYEFWTALLAAKLDFVIRVGANVRLLKKLGYVRESGNTVYLWPHREFEKGDPPLVLRLVKLQGDRHPWHLLTSVSGTRLSDRQIAEIYKLRWGIELYYRHFKETFDRRKLRSHQARHVDCEAHWSMLGLWAMMLHAKHELHRRHIPPEQLSVAGMLRAYRTAIRERRSTPELGTSLWQLLAKARIDPYVRQNKSSRAHPQKKYESSPGPPIIKNATRQQIAKASQLRQRNKKGVTA